VGQLSTHFPSNKTNPGIQEVHCAWSIVDEALKVGILQDVHFELQAGYEGLGVTIHIRGRKATHCHRDVYRYRLLAPRIVSAYPY
jgi:hypothetical protein